MQHSRLPEELIREVSGQVAVEEESPAVAPLTHYPDAAINLASTQLILEHQHKFCDQRVLAQVGWGRLWLGLTESLAQGGTEVESRGEQDRTYRDGILQAR